jgi:hypothetical protein
MKKSPPGEGGPEIEDLHKRTSAIRPSKSRPNLDRAIIRSATVRSRTGRKPVTVPKLSFLKGRRP